MKPEMRIVEGQIRECYGRAVYTHKTHEKCADILLQRLQRIKTTQIVLSALSAGGFLYALFGYSQLTSLLGVSISTLLLVLNAYTMKYDLGELAQKHKQAANDIWLVREQYLSLLTDLAAGSKSGDAILTERDRLLSALHGIYAGSPSTTYAAYRKAQVALQHHEDMTFSDAEIDALLPSPLRRGS